MRQLLPFVLVAVLTTFSSPAIAAEVGTLSVWRLYNPNSGEHFYTTSGTERDSLAVAGWRYEGIGWVAPAASRTPVYRLYSGTDHHYTTSSAERDGLEAEGWSYEGVSWYSDDAHTVAILRQFNPNVDPCAQYNNSGSHNHTAAVEERDHLVSLGWHDEGVGWYALAGGAAYANGDSIMGASSTSAASLAAYFNSKHKVYPSWALAQGGAATIDDFTRLVLEEANAEGVRAEVVFCQAMLETGWLQFGGDVSVSQFNFAGIGAVGGGAGGASFADVRTGIRAQVQHLKAYASTLPLNNACVDPRFSLVGRGVAPKVTDLNGRWAVPGTNYGQTILKLVYELDSFA